MRRLLSALAAVAVVMAVGAPPAWAQQLVVDLADESTAVDEHTARLAWHLTADNLDPANPAVSAAWYSKYLDEPAETGGRLVIDLEAGTVAGELVQRWACTDCVESAENPFLTTETGWSASIAEGRLDPDGSGWRIDGTVTIRYHATASDDESIPPSSATCGDGPCPNTCTQGVCQISEQSSSTVPLTGWIEGTTVSLAFEDGLLENVADMDVSALADTQYFLSRFSMTVIATSPAAAAPPEDAAPADEEAAAPPPPAATQDDAAAAADAEVAEDAPDGEAVQGDEAEEGEEESGEAEEESEEAGATDAAPGILDGDRSNRTPLLVALTLAVLVLILVLLRGTLMPSDAGDVQTPAEVMREVTSDLVTDPAALMERASDLTDIEAQRQERAAKGAAGPQFESAGAPAGKVTITQPVEAVAGGATLTLPAGTSYSAGATVNWHGRNWTPVRVGEKWWWVPSHDSGVWVGGEVAIPQVTPDKLSPPPYQVFRLSEATEVTTADAAVVLDPGDYQLGDRVVTADGVYYEVLTTKGWKIGRVKQSSLPKDSGLPSSPKPSDPSSSAAPP